MTYVLIIIVCLLLMVIGSFLQNGWLATIAFLIILVTLVTSCEQSEWHQASEKERHNQAALEAQPHVIREVDGCKVYTFKSGDRYHYFTKCGNITTTESSYSVSCGKNCSRTEVETIVTENKK